MSHKNKVLVVGATGLLGVEAVRRLQTAGVPVRALVRSTADSGRRHAVESAGAEIASGDLKHRASIEAACRDVATVVTTATAMVSRQEGDSIEGVDELGQLALVDAARAAGVRRFVFVSFQPGADDYGLQRAKQRVETAVRESGMEFTILRPVYFTEVWLSPVVGFHPLGGSVRVLGGGDAAVSWVSLHDVARFVAAAAVDPRFDGKVVPLGGPDALSPLQVLKIFEELGCGDVTIERVPLDFLENQLRAARHPLEEAFAGLMLGAAKGQTVDPSAALELLPGRLRTVREYAKEITDRSKSVQGGLHG